MARLAVPIAQINLHHSKGASAILARSMAVMQTVIVIIQEPWLLLGCDANSHHIGWGCSNINPRGESLHKFIMDINLMILNRGTVPTFMDCRRQEVLDITICTEGVADLVRNWRVSGEPSGSDHRQIRYNLRYMVNKEWGRNPRTTNWEGYRMDLEAILKKAPNRFHSEENLEYAAKLEVRRLFNKARRKNSTADWEANRNAQRGYSKTIIIAKRKSWRDFNKGIESTSEASRLNRILSKDNTLRLGCLKLPNGNYTKTVEESLKHLMSISKQVKETIETFDWEILSHAAYSPDLAPSDYYLFASMGHALAQQRFTSYEDVRKWLDNWFGS
ncbi:PREDICTED: uncharacterized protein LOC108782006 [Cyphomyrmex costatus]|uniref:uncharacterized protein LOC108782006 n=1 Tax=Cyphomyrmex costatus TaxID=456900 RepID=UPI00085223D9|nr:PREDICTED: uncharacterized protein LOC108782006 [Cyphomyrmex costatus]